MLKNLKILREQYGISQKKLAEKVNVSQQSINKYENHQVEPNIETLILLSDFFGTTVDFLIGRTDSNKSSSYLSDEENRILLSYRKLNQSDKEIFKNLIQRFANS